jgi:hypothetical protein
MKTLPISTPNGRLSGTPLHRKVEENRKSKQASTPDCRSTKGSIFYNCTLGERYRMPKI